MSFLIFGPCLQVAIQIDGLGEVEEVVHFLGDTALLVELETAQLEEKDLCKIKSIVPRSQSTQAGKTKQKTGQSYPYVQNLAIRYGIRSLLHHSKVAYSVTQ